MNRMLFIVPVLCMFLLCSCTEREPRKPRIPANTAQENESSSPENVPPVEPAQEEKTGGDTEENKEVVEIKKKNTEPDSEVGVLETSLGTMVIEFYPGLAPKTVARIKELIKKGFYDGLIFHRVVPNFCIQGGDPTGTGRGGTGVNLPAEFTDTPFEDGSMGMARSSDPNSGDCQFFITLSRAPNVENLDNNYTLFGKVIEGLEVAHKIEKVELISQLPKDDVTIISFRLKKREKEEK